MPLRKFCDFILGDQLCNWIQLYMVYTLPLALRNILWGVVCFSGKAEGKNSLTQIRFTDSNFIMFKSWIKVRVFEEM